MKACNAFGMFLFIVMLIGHNGCDESVDPGPVDSDTGTDSAVEQQDVDTATDSAVEQQDVDTAWEEWVGTACTDHFQCQQISGEAGAFCHPAGGYCSKGCVPANALDPQGGCGETNAVCTLAIYTVPVAASHICVEPCVPEPDRNPCSAPTLTCDPRWGFSYEGMTATCQLLACSADAQCWPVTGEVCQNDADCPGGTCAGDPKVCIYPLECREETGRCVFSNPVKPDADIGDPCRNDMECGAGTQCWGSEAASLIRDSVPNGYCTKIGCRTISPEITGVPNQFEGNIEFDCGSNAACIDMDQGWCMRRCDPSDTTGELSCRQGAWEEQSVIDSAGDYECIHDYFGGELYESYVRNAGTEAAEVLSDQLSYPPVCMPTAIWLNYNTSATIAENFELNDYNCSDFWGGGDTDMQRRDPETGEVVEEGGYCLDGTTSGPGGDWS